MADTKKGGLSIAVTTDAGLSSLIHGLSPLSHDNMEDNTLSSLIELSRTCEALQKSSAISPQPLTPPSPEDLKLNSSSPSTEHNGAYTNSLDSRNNTSITSTPPSATKSSPFSSSLSPAMSNCITHLDPIHRISSTPIKNKISLNEEPSLVHCTGLNNGDSELESDSDNEFDSEDAEENRDYTSFSIPVSEPAQTLPSSLCNNTESKSQNYSRFNSVSELRTPSCQTPKQSQENPPVRDELSDVESFDGKIVYNPDGSAYIIEGESDLSDSESLLDVPRLEGSIVDHRGKPSTSQVPSFPQIANAFYIHKNPSAFYNSYFMFPPEKRAKPEAPIMHSYKVYDLRSKNCSKSDSKCQEEDKENTSKMALLNSSQLSDEITAVPTKPILMCFICKLSFGYAKSFMAHAVGEHSMSLCEDEREIMSRKNASAIIQGIGKDKSPLMSFLEPTSTQQKEPCSESGSQTESHPYLPPPLFKTNVGGSGLSAASNTNVSYVYSNTKVTPVEHVSPRDSKCDTGHRFKTENGLCEVQRSPPSLVSSDSKGASHHLSQSDDAGANLSPSLSPRVGSRPPSQHLLRSPQKDNSPSLQDASRSITPKRSASDPSDLYRPYDNDSPRSQELDLDRRMNCHSLYKLSESGPESVSVIGSSHSAMLTSQPSPNEMSSHAMSQSAVLDSPTGSNSGIVIRAGCEDHPQGNISGVECPKCDLILGSPRSLGGHMTMIHSRNSCKTLKCPKCNWHYKYQETLEIHMKEKHPENDTQCIYCLTGQSHPRLARGEAYTCGYKPYRCEVCNYSTTTKGNLSIHMQSDKHINNMQEIQNGTVNVNNVEVKMPPVQPPPPPPPPALTPDPNAMKKNKPKPTWRCDVCNYETNVARNLRIHMTSEKHTHNMLVLQQNVKHMQRDMQFQMSQLALMGQDPLALMAGLPPGMAPGLPPYALEQMFMGAVPGVPGMPGMVESPVDLSTQENGLPPQKPGNPNNPNFPMDLKNNNNEPCRIFQCAVCNVFSTDSLESLHQHMQLDRQKPAGEHDDSVAMVGGTYMCNLCQYKTNLKANFQLHCKTDKHLQRQQLVNHIREGGPANEWRLKYMSAGNPCQVRCNACDYYTNSIHKLQLHRTNPRHESNGKLFHHLQTRESCLSPNAHRYYHCTLCNHNTRAKINLIQHIRSMKHMRNESMSLIKLKEQGKEHEYILDNIFQVKECSEEDLVKFDEPDGDLADGPEGDLPEYGSDSLFKDCHDLKGGAKLNCPFCTFSTTNEMQIQLHVQTQHMAPHNASLNSINVNSHNSVNSAHKESESHCPLCQEKCASQGSLEKHLFQVHSVSAEGMHRLLSLVFNPDVANSSPSKSSPSSTTTNSKPNSTLTSPQSTASDMPTRSEKSQNPRSEAQQHPHRDDPQDSHPSNKKSQQGVTPSGEEPLDFMEIQAEILESQALKLAEEASMEGVVLPDKDQEDQYRCQTCAKSFHNVDTLYSHQNELGHLELKQTPGGPGYLCWKKGCNQYFKTAEALQNHFRQIHVSSPMMSVSERHAYKFRCTQCSLAFKSLEKLQLHSFYHIVRTATKCVVCNKHFRSIATMRRHVEGTHADTITPAELEEYRNNLAATAPLAMLGMPMADPMMLNAMAMGQVPPLIPLMGQFPRQMPMFPEQGQEAETVNDRDGKLSQNYIKSEPTTPPETPDKSSMRSDVSTVKIETSQAESSPSRPMSPMDTEESSSLPEGEDYKDQHFFEDYINSQAIAENSYSDPNRKYKCHRCKVAFTKQNYLTAHNKTLMHRKGDKGSYPMEKYLDPNRPYKCDVCKESFTQKNILLVHYNSVSHLHKLKQQQQGGTDGDGSSQDEFPQTETSVSDNNNTSMNSSNTITVTPTTPDEKKPFRCNICKVAYSQSATMDIHIRSVLHQTRASKLQELAATGQVDLTQPLIEQPDMSTPIKVQQVLQEQQKALQEIMLKQQKESSEKLNLMSPPPLVPVETSSPMNQMSSVSQAKTTTTSTVPSSTVTSASSPVVSTADVKVKSENESGSATYICQKCNSGFGNQDLLTQHQQLLCFGQNPFLRGMPRFKPQVQRNLLENIGFECVMQFNEFQQKLKKQDKDNKDDDKSSNPGSNPGNDNPPEQNNDEGDKDSDKKSTTSEEERLSVMPEMNKCQCLTCNKEFSSIWVLKAHQEEVHKQLLPIEFVEEYSAQFKDDYDKKQQQQAALSLPTSEAPSVSSEPDTPSKPKTSDVTNLMGQAAMLDEKAMMGMPHLAADLAMAQAMQMMQMPMLMSGMMPMNIPGGPNMPMGMNMIPPLMPMMMHMGANPEMFSSVPPMQMMDPNMMLLQQQQAAALAAQQQKRARTRINDEQLKILRTYFDINNSPSEEQIMEMADKSGLPPKVIKHWFRNTLFKERQRNKDSPYNFSIPPSTSLNLEDYEKTGKIVEDSEMEKTVDQEQRIQEQRVQEAKAKAEADRVKLESAKAAEQERREEMAKEMIRDIKREIPEVSRSSPQRQESKPQASESVSRFCPSPQVKQSNPRERLERFSLDLQKREAFTPKHESITSSAPPTPVFNPVAPLSLAMPPVLPPPGLAALAPPGVNFGDFSSAMQLLPHGPPITSSAGHPSVNPTTSQYSTPTTPKNYQPPVMSPSHSSNSMQGKRANRTRFTDYQIKVLQEYFEQNAYPKDDDLEHLSRLLNLSPRVIVVWFQNARQKARKNYENQPPIDMSDENSKFTRTPGLNYQCKKCFTVFQRYYELIKHQRTQCYKDDKKPPFNFSHMSTKSGASSTSFGDESSNDEEDDSKLLEYEHSPRAAGKSSSAMTPNAKGIEYKCEKCNLVLPRLELWREHQTIHNMNPSLFPFPNSAFAMLQNVAQLPQPPQHQSLHQQQQEQQQQQPKPQHIPTSTPQLSPMIDDRLSSKRPFEYDDDRDDLPRDKRMRTTILPEQLDYLYQKYQIDCNPSRKQLENIASEVGLKKRVVQVWFQNTRARERKGQYRAHQQLIHKRCPICRALFRAKSALESHLATKHPEEMAREEINVDNIPDAEPDSMPPQGMSPSAMLAGGPGLDMAKLLNNPYNMPNPLMPLVPGAPGSGDHVQSNMKKLYEDSLKKYLDELSHASHQPKSGAFNPEEYFPRGVKQETDDTPLDLSKPHGEHKMEDYHSALSISFSVDDSEMSDSSDHDESQYMSASMNQEESDNMGNQMLAEGSNPSSPSSSTSSNQVYYSGLAHQKRYRTQMSSVQIRLMKNLFTMYKTPTMAECEFVGREIGLPKRVVQVWFQNARAKEKKAKLNYIQAFGGSPGTDLERSPEECTLCNFKFSHKYTVQDHIFTRKHIDNVKAYVNKECETEQKMAAGVAGGIAPKRESSETRKEQSEEAGSESRKRFPATPDPASMVAHPHLAQLHAMGLQALSSQGGSNKESQSKVKVKQEPKETETKERKPPTSSSVPTSASSQMGHFSGFGGMPPPLGLGDLNNAAAAGMLPLMFPGMGGMMPGMSMMPPGMMPPGMMPGAESMMMYDPTTFGTPLPLLQIPQQAIQHVQSKVTDNQCGLTRYTQDCSSMNDLKNHVAGSDYNLIQPSYIDVGFICKKCHMVYPGKEACVNHQMAVCFQGQNLSEVKAILKLEQTMYKCSVCREKLATLEDIVKHCRTESHHRQVNRRSSDSRPLSRASTVTPPSAASTPRVHAAEGCTDNTH